MTRFRLRAALVFVGIASFGSFESRARATEGEVTSDTTTQFYDVRSPTGRTTLLRRRLTSTLGVTVYDLLPRPKEAGQELLPDLVFRARLRYDADYGAFGVEADPNAADYYTPGFSRGPVDLMYAYVEGRRFFHGLFGFKLGRQYQTDALGWWAFDGAQLRLTTPAYFAVEAYGGLEVRGGLPLSGPSGRWERDGVWRGDRDGFQPNAYPSFQQAAVAPAFGAAIETAGVTWLHGRLSYRRVYNTGDPSLTQFSSPLASAVDLGARVSQDRLGYSILADWDKVGAVSGGLVYDLYSALLSNVYASAEVRPTKTLTVGADYDYFRPTFDADSIWNFLGAQPMNDVGVRARFEPTSKLAFSGGGHVRVFGQENTAASVITSTIPTTALPGSGASFAGGGSLGLRYVKASSAISFRGLADVGEAGDRVGGDVMGERTLGGHIVFRARVGLWHWEDKLRPDRSAVSVGTVLGAAYRFFHGSQVGTEIEADVNRLVGVRFRWITYLSLVVAK